MNKAEQLKYRTKQIEVLIESSVIDTEHVNGLLSEANELLAIFASSQITAKSANCK